MKFLGLIALLYQIKAIHLEQQMETSNHNRLHQKSKLRTHIGVRMIEQEQDLVNDDLSVDDQADLDLKAIFHHQRSDEEKAHESETSHEDLPESPNKDEADQDADQTLRRQAEMESKLAGNLNQNEELNGKSGDSVLGKAILNSKDETDEIMDGNERQDLEDKRQKEQLAENEISECAGSEDKTDVDFALKKVIGGVDDQLEASTENNSLKRLTEEAGYEIGMKHHDHTTGASYSNNSMKNIVEESIDDSIMSQVDEERDEAPIFDELLMVNDDTNPEVIMDTHGKVRFVDPSSNVAGESAKLDKYAVFYLCMVKDNQIATYAGKANKLSKAIDLFNQVKSLRKQDGMLLASNGKIVEYDGSLNQPKMKALIGFATERGKLSCDGKQYKESAPLEVNGAKKNDSLVQLENELQMLSQVTHSISDGAWEKYLMQGAQALSLKNTNCTSRHLNEMSIGLKLANAQTRK